MANVDISCNNCGATAPAPKDGTPVKCMFCGGSIQYIAPAKDSSQAASPQVENLFTMAESALEAGNHEEAYNYYNRVIEFDTKNSRAWVGKGMSAVWQSTLANDRSGEMLPAFKNALKFSHDSEKKAHVFEEVAEGTGRAYNALATLALELFQKTGYEYVSSIDDYAPDEQAALDFRVRISGWITKYMDFYDWFDDEASKLEEGSASNKELWTLMLDHYACELLDFVWMNVPIEHIDFPMSAWSAIYYKDQLTMTAANDLGHTWSKKDHPLDWDIYGLMAQAIMSRHEKRDYSLFSEEVKEKYSIHDPRQFAPEDASGSCFIATATFDSRDERELGWLRALRDKRLVEHSLGRQFVSWYYRNGPILARVLSGTNPSKATTRYFLLMFVRLGRKFIKLD